MATTREIDYNPYDLEMHAHPLEPIIAVTCTRHHQRVEVPAGDFMTVREPLFLARDILNKQCSVCKWELRKMSSSRHPLDPAYEEKE